MDYLIIKSFIPEIFLSIFILCQLVYNSYLSYSISLNFPTIEKEICIQISLAFTILFLLFLNLKVEAFLSTFLLVNNIGIYLYSFSLNPKLLQPSGSMNFSKIDDAYIQLTMNNCINYQNPILLKAYAIQYNLFKISNGIGGLVYTV